MPVVPATREAEAGELLEPGSGGLQWAEIVPLLSSLVTEQDSITKKTKQNKRELWFNKIDYIIDYVIVSKSIW